MVIGENVVTALGRAKNGRRHDIEVESPVVIFPSEPADRVGRDDLLQQDAAIGGLGSYPVAATRLGSRVRSSLPP